jgi:uncharacterized protein YndB with AHSA1/START domain
MTHPGVTSPDESGAPARLSNGAVRAKTGRDWRQWFAALDEAGCATMKHAEIVAVLTNQYRLGPWWRQMVAAQYEQARGLRVAHEKPDGFEIGVSRTYEAEIERVFMAWIDAERRRAWLGDHPLTISKATAGKSVRVTWAAGGRVDVNLYPKTGGAVQVALRHGKLPDAAAGEAMKAFWAAALDRLKAATQRRAP